MIECGRECERENVCVRKTKREIPFIKELYADSNCNFIFNAIPQRKRERERERERERNGEREREREKKREREREKERERERKRESEIVGRFKL